MLVNINNLKQNITNIRKYYMTVELNCYCKCITVKIIYINVATRKYKLEVFYFYIKMKFLNNPFE